MAPMLGKVCCLSVLLALSLSLAEASRCLEGSVCQPEEVEALEDELASSMRTELLQRGYIYVQSSATVAGLEAQPEDETAFLQVFADKERRQATEEARPSASTSADEVAKTNGMRSVEISGEEAEVTAE
mmetsp:Transcript_37120/g.56152  ORF Transcript_37120/g.56152 Transcript_37120/m.56152 type:complete len:129 (+) Transcript_37120:120-506(+)